MTAQPFDKYIKRGAFHHSWFFDEKQPWYREIINTANEFCISSTLEIGCGDGVLAKLITDKGYDYTGIDSDPVAIAMAKVLVPKGRFLLKDVTSPTRGVWDYMACVNVIEHLEHPEALLTILESNVSTGAIIITDNKDFPHETSKYHVKEYTLDELTNFFLPFKPRGFELGYGQFIGVEIKLEATK